MRHRVTGRQFGRASAPRKALFRSLVTELLKRERIQTTLAKAREVRPIAERMVTLGKAGSLHDRRRAAAFINEGEVVGKVFGDLAERYSQRAGGYTRITKLGPRKGDAAEMALLELV
jgi:large subunit ribosomal protein L17